MMSHRAAALLGLVFTVGCSSGNFTVAEADGAVEDTGASGDTGTASDTSAPLDSTTPPTDSGTPIDSGSDGDTGVTAIDGGGAETGACDPSAQPDPKTGVFVSTSGNDTTGDGTALTPFRTIGRGILKAVARSVPNVYLDAGTYAESVLIGASDAGVVVEGGWKATGSVWTRNCAETARAQTVIASPTNVGVTIDTTTKLSGLRRLTVTTKAKGTSTADGPSESMFGVFIRGAGAIAGLDDVAVIAGDAANGGAAKGGSPGVGTSCMALCDSGASGLAAAPGALPTLPGYFDGKGFTPTDGNPGTKGPNGAMGTPAPMAASSSCATACTGMGGVAGGFCGAIMSTLSGSPGTCGCGGVGGAPGGAGRGGGASVAVLIAAPSAKVQILRSSLAAGKGGDGSDGGSGADGATGSAGTTGAPTSCAPGCTRELALPFNCVLSPASTVLAGTTGGTGGKGGRSGNGSPGAGGPSYALVKTDGTSALTLTAVTFKHGAGGSGGLIGPSGDTLPGGL